MLNLKKCMFNGCIFSMISLVVGTSLLPMGEVEGETMNENIEYSKSEALSESGIRINATNTITQSIVEEEKQLLLPNGQVINVDTNLSVREEPNKNSEIKAVLMNGMTFEILSKMDGWYKIKYNDDIQGFVYEDYVEEYKDVPKHEIYKQEKTYKRAIKAELTAYCDDPRCSGGWGSLTAMQTRTRIGVIAAPKDIPLGSEMYIPELTNLKSDGVFEVEDRGGAINVKNDGTYVIDVWVPSYEEAVAFGRKKTTIYLL